jgi:hypothetical protein
VPLPGENVEIVLQGLDQKTSAKLTAPGTVERARNVQFDKAGQLDKRDGYLLLENAQVDGVAMPAHQARLAQLGDELLMLSPVYAFAMHDPAEGLQSSTRAMKRRGLISSGTVSASTVVVSTDAEDS